MLYPFDAVLKNQMRMLEYETRLEGWQRAMAAEQKLGARPPRSALSYHVEMLLIRWRRSLIQTQAKPHVSLLEKSSFK